MRQNGFSVASATLAAAEGRNEHGFGGEHLDQFYAVAAMCSAHTSMLLKVPRHPACVTRGTSWPPPGDASHAGIVVVLGAVHLRHPCQSWAIPQTAGGEDLSRLLLELCVVQLTVGTISLFVLHPQNKASYQSCQIARPATAVRLLPSSGV